MKVVFSTNTRTGKRDDKGVMGVYKVGKEYDIADKEARYFIANGKAVSKKEKSNKK